MNGDGRRRKAVRAGVFLLVLLYPPFVYIHGVQISSASLVDFPSFYGAAQLVAHGQSPYGPQALDGIAAQRDKPVFPFIYPPFGLLPFLPLASLSYDHAALAAAAVGFAAVLMFLWFFCVRPRPGPLENSQTRMALLAAVSVVYVLTFDPLAINFHAGQTNAVILLMIAVALDALHEERPAFTGSALAAACLLKIYFLLFIPFLIIKRRYRATAWLVGILAAACVVTLIVWPAALWSDWLRDVFPYGGYGRFPPGLFPPGRAANQSINGFVARFLAGDAEMRLRPILPLAAAAAPLAYAICGAVIAGAMVCVYRSTRRFGKRRLADEFALVLVVTFLVTPFSWEHHLVFLLPASIIVIRRLVERATLDGWDIAAGCALLLLAWPVPFHDAALRRGVLRLFISAKFYGVAMICGYLFRALMAVDASAGLTSSPAVSEPHDEQALTRRSTAAT
jgi:Glycosyltransferase family 87